jgi:two-component system, LuxR family, sensor kinase FixL
VRSTSIDNKWSDKERTAFTDLLASLSARLAQATGPGIADGIDRGLGELLTFFGVDHCGILEVQADVRQARLRHYAFVPDVDAVPSSVDYGSLFPLTHQRAILHKEVVVQTAISDLPPECPDRRSCLALNLECIVTIPISVEGRATHALVLAAARPINDWPRPVITELQAIAETFLSTLRRRHAEEALQASQRSLAQAQRIAAIGTYVHDWVSETTTLTPGSRSILGLSGELNRDLRSVVHGEDRDRVDDTIKRVLAERGPRWDLEYRIQRPDGVVRTLREFAETDYGDGTPLVTMGTVQDVSELRVSENEARRLRLELWHAGRLAQAGLLTGSLSHELNQPLTAILANAETGQKLLTQDNVDVQALQEVLDAIVRDDLRAAAITGNLRALLRREAPPWVRFDLYRAVADVLALFKSEIDARRARVSLHGAGIYHVNGEKTQIQQVVLNLVSNALHALDARSDGERSLSIRLETDAEGRVVASFTDNGCGIAPGEQERIFESFYTTRKDGLGLGLSVSRSIIEAHHGRIEARPNPDVGATFRFWLPVEHTAIR